MLIMNFLLAIEAKLFVFFDDLYLHWSRDLVNFEFSFAKATILPSLMTLTMVLQRIL